MYVTSTIEKETLLIVSLFLLSSKLGEMTGLERALRKHLSSIFNLVTSTAIFAQKWLE